MADLVEEALDLDPRRNQSSERKKLYEEMLLSEIPGTTRVNEPMHAVLESDLSPNSVGNGQSVRNHALIHYLATLATSNSRNDMFDFDFVESLLKNGADVNSGDKTGQTVFHEVARSWNIDVASFLIKHGANVNLQDDFGRSPLHVAAAVDYVDMVKFLIHNGADAEIKTYGEEQTPTHFAAKNDAVHSLQALLSNGANFDARDSKNRSPLQVAAEMNRSKAAKLLIKEGAPTGVCDNLGNSALSLLIEKIPELALEAMDQFHSVDTINRKQFYFLNYLEGPKLKEQKTPAKTPLEIAVQNERFDVILHPVMQRLIGLKWQVYGKWGAILDLVINLVYTILWTVLGVTLPTHGLHLYLPLREKYWRLAIGALLFLLTVFEIKKQITGTMKTRRELKKWKEWRASELEKDFEYCHPRWPQETQYLKAEIKAVRNLSLISGSDLWIYFDWLTLVLILAAIVSHLVFFRVNVAVTMHVHRFCMILLLLVLWFRIFKYARPFESAGPFVVIFGCVLGDIVKWGFLNMIIIVPFTCAFWITFGKISLTPVEGYDNVGPLIYNMFSMMVGANHNYEHLEAANAIMARLLCGTFIGLASIVTINLLIALLTNTFERLYQNAVANAVMQRARTILLLQKSLRRPQKVAYYKMVRDKGSPEVINTDLGGIPSPQDRGDRATLEGVREDLSSLMDALGEHSGGRRTKKKGELDMVKIDVSKVKRLQEELTRDFEKTTALLLNMKEAVERLSRDRHCGNQCSFDSGASTVGDIPRNDIMLHGGDSDSTTEAGSGECERPRCITNKQTQSKRGGGKKTDNGGQSNRTTTTITKKATRDHGDSDEARHRRGERNSKSSDDQFHGPPSDNGDRSYELEARHARGKNRSNGISAQKRPAMLEKIPYGNNTPFDNPRQQLQQIQQPYNAHLAYPPTTVHFSNGGEQSGVPNLQLYHLQPDFTNGIVYPPPQAGDAASRSDHQYGTTMLNLPSHMDHITSNQPNQNSDRGQARMGQSTSHHVTTCSSCNAAVINVGDPTNTAVGVLPYPMVGVSNTPPFPDTIMRTAIHDVNNPGLPSHVVRDGGSTQVIYPHALGTTAGRTEPTGKRQQAIEPNLSLHLGDAPNAADTSSDYLTTSPQATRSMSAKQLGVNMETEDAMNAAGDGSRRSSANQVHRDGHGDNGARQLERQATFYLPQTGICTNVDR